MAMTSTRKNGFFDVSKAFGDFGFPGLDAGALAESQRKNLEALTQANQLAVEGVRTLVQRHTEIVQQAFKEASALAREWAQPRPPRDRFVKQAETAKQVFDDGLANARELNELTAKAGTDVLNVIARRISESFDELRLYAKRQSVVE
jgi:phasin family protein